MALFIDVRRSGQGASTRRASILKLTPSVQVYFSEEWEGLRGCFDPSPILLELGPQFFLPDPEFFWLDPDPK